MASLNHAEVVYSSLMRSTIFPVFAFASIMACASAAWEKSNSPPTTSLLGIVLLVSHTKHEFPVYVRSSK